jgi:polyisoprenoid-binding protein YceI
MRVFLLLAMLGCFVASPVLAKSAHVWAVIPDKSSLGFTITQMGAPLNGRFERFRPEIVFDENNLAGSSIKVAVDIGSINTQSPDRDDAIMGAEWFDALHFPTANFTSASIHKTGAGHFEATGTLTIRDVSLPVTLPFTLQITPKDVANDEAVAEGAVTLDRLAFKLGGEKWADTSAVGKEATVHFHVVAVFARHSGK